MNQKLIEVADIPQEVLAEARLIKETGFAGVGRFINAQELECITAEDLALLIVYARGTDGNAAQDGE